MSEKSRIDAVHAVGHQGLLLIWQVLHPRTALGWEQSFAAFGTNGG